MFLLFKKTIVFSCLIIKMLSYINLSMTSNRLCCYNWIQKQGLFVGAPDDNIERINPSRRRNSRVQAALSHLQQQSWLLMYHWLL